MIFFTVDNYGGIERRPLMQSHIADILKNTTFFTHSYRATQYYLEEYFSSQSVSKVAFMSIEDLAYLH